MKIKYILSVIAIVAISKSSFAQYAQDAVRYSTFQTGSSSRIKAIGNAGTAVGGDVSSISGNPAGLGFFTRTEYSITPEYNGINTNSTYLGQSSTATNNNLNLNNASIVFYSRANTPRGVDKTKGWLSFNFGIGYARTNNFDENVTYAAKNATSSINDYYASLANSSGIGSSTLPGFAYNQNLIDLYGSPATYQKNNVAGTPANQSNNISRSGGQSEFDLSVGTNYSNKLYLGFGLALTDLTYSVANDFYESGVASILEGTPAVGVNRNYNSVYSQQQVTSGSGVNAKFGLMYKITEAVRFGALITTPTYLSINDTYSEGLTTTLSSGVRYQDGPQDYPLSYTMRTPMKLAGGLSVFLKQFGFLSGDVEYVDYSTTHLNGNSDYSNSYDNNIIKSTYRATVNAHVGAEARLTNNFSLRGGYGMQGSPLKQNGSAINTISGGLGYRFNSGYYIDATYAHVDGNQVVTPYTLSSTSPTASVNKTLNNVFLTLGFRY
ncbi:MAG: hypothetical protein ABI367_08970 [Mucilaginibacter sp.]